MRRRSPRRSPRKGRKAARPAPPPSPGKEEPLRLPILGALLLIGMVLVAYVPALRAGFVWDDGALTKNPVVQSPGGLWLIWTRPSAYATREAHYWPLVYTTFWLEYALWGLRPFGYHLINVLLYALNCVLLWRLLRRVGLPGAWLASAVFALHPVHVESVAWVIERKDQLAALFYLSAFLAYVRFEDSRSPRAYGAAIALFLCAMLSKSVAVSLPVALGLWLWWKRGRVAERDLARLAPILALGLAIAAADAAVASQHEPYNSGLSFVERGLLAARAFWFYASKLAWPANLVTIYPRWEIHAGSAAAWVYAAAAAAIFALLWAKRKAWGNGPLAAVLYFGVALGPTLGLVDHIYMRNSFVADRFQFLASIGLIALFSALAVSMARDFRSAPRWLPGLAAAALLGVLGLLTWRHAEDYKNYETLFAATLARNPNSWAAHNNLGMALSDQGKYEEAVQHFDASIAANPKNEKAHYNKGRAFQLQGRIDEAIACYRESLRVSPRYTNALVNLGAALRKKGQLDEAIQCYRKALQIDPKDVGAHNNLGVALCNIGQAAEGLEHFRLALKFQPNHPDALANLKRFEQESQASGPTD